MPGYSGYIPNYQTEYPLNKGAPAHKYEDINPEERTLSTDSPWITNYMHTVDPSYASMSRQARSRAIQSNLVENFKRTEEKRQAILEARYAVVHPRVRFQACG